MGAFRLFLAFSVIGRHTGTTVLGFSGIGPLYSVKIFSMISGFYIAMVLTGKYKDKSPFMFYKGRILRLFPTYYISVILMLLVTYTFHVDYFLHLKFISQLAFLFHNTFIFGHELPSILCLPTIDGECAKPMKEIINPPAWSLSLELGFYLLAPFIVKSIKRTYIFMLYGIFYLIFHHFSDYSNESFGILKEVTKHTYTYTFYPSSFLYFGLGSLMYHLTNTKIESYHYLIALATVFLLSLTGSILPLGYLIFIALSIPVLFKYTKNNMIDRKIGELSYPVYIIHFPLITALSPMKITHPELFKYVEFGSWIAILSCLAGLIIYWVVERKITGIRHSGKFLKETHKPGKYSIQAVKTFICIYLLIPVLITGCLYSMPESVVSTQPYPLTDANWLNGVGTSGDAVFFVRYTKANDKAFVPGVKIKFLTTGQIRTIKSVSKSNAFINITLSGEKLDVHKVGYPNKFEIIQ